MLCDNGKESNGPFFTWFIFLLLFYSLEAAYLSGSGRIMIDAFEGFLQIRLPPFFDILPLLIIFAPFLYFGISVIDRLNRYLMMGMLMTYVTVIIWLLPNVDTALLGYNDWSFSFLSFSVVVTSFGYQAIIPSLVNYLDRDVPSIKKCLFYGSIIPLLVYILWELVMLGTISVDGQNGLAHAYRMDYPLSKLLRTHTSSDFLVALSRSFSIFSIVTSFLGVTQGLFDFLKDGIQAGKNQKRILLAFLLTFIPPILMIVFLENKFLKLLDYAGAMASITLGIIPVIIIWNLRKLPKQHSEYRAPGNERALVASLAFFTLIVLIEVFKNLGFIHFPLDALIYTSNP
jgi:tyrosine-specific transport protein